MATRAINILNELVLPLEANTADTYSCPDCHEQLIFKHGKINVPHFAHRSCCRKKSYESNTHKEAKLKLKSLLETRPLTMRRACVKCGSTAEMPIIPYHKDHSVELEYDFEYNGHRRADVAYLCGEMIIFEICHTNPTAESNRPEPWYEIDAQTLLDSPADSTMIDCIRKTVCTTCYDPNGIIYFNQRGAGCGKTYESIQLIRHDERFNDKELFIYLTKMHSAKEIIFNELDEQYKRGALDGLELIEEEYSEYKCKQYNIAFVKNEAKIEIVIGTIDSFTCAIADKDNLSVHPDYFQSLVDTIKRGFIKRRGVSYSKLASIDLNKKCLIIIDEAQDLGVEYILAFDTLVKQSNIDLYVIGDKLQSIWGPHNIYTHIEDSKDLRSKIIKSAGVNQVMRFHNPQLQDFVNTIVPFKKYGLPAIEKICDLPACKYAHETIRPYTIFQVPKVRLYRHTDDYEENCSSADIYFDTVIQYMSAEVDKYNYLPQHFMFIFPVLKNNAMVALLEIRINQFWMTRFADPAVVIADQFWKDEKAASTPRYVVVHKSTEGQSINLKESEFATRILSVHASKGSGREVVFLLGMAENGIKLFSNGVIDITYESYLHVAITRQKRAIYIALERNERDDLWKRFKPSGIVMNRDLKPIAPHIGKQVAAAHFSAWCISAEFKIMQQSMIRPEFAAQIPDRNAREIIDFGHHVVRHSVMLYSWMSHIINEGVMDTPFKEAQFVELLRIISGQKVEVLDYTGYLYRGKLITRRDETFTSKCRNDDFLLLSFRGKNNKFDKYIPILVDFIKKIQARIIGAYRKNTVPLLCPMETTIVVFMIDFNNHGLYSSATIVDIYNILIEYDNNFGERDGHDDCPCNKHFRRPLVDNRETHIGVSITNHYELISQLTETYGMYKNILAERFAGESFTYNIDKSATHLSTDFELRCTAPIIAYSASHVVQFAIRPQFNLLNFNEIIISGIFNQFIISVCDGRVNKRRGKKDNKDRYGGKKITFCVITLDTAQPLFFDFIVDVDVMKSLIRKYIVYSRTPSHEDVFDLCQYYDTADSTYPFTKLVSGELKSRSKIDVETYITKYLDAVSMDAEEYEHDIYERDRILSQIRVKDTFLHKLAFRLDRAITELLDVS